MATRPEGFDYGKPDPPEIRCRACNPDGMNRTGWKPLGYIGASTTGMFAVPCPAACRDGLVRVFDRGEGI